MAPLHNYRIRYFTGLLLASFLILGCSPLIAPYQLVAYENATKLKARSLAMIDSSSKSYSSQKGDLDALFLEIDEAYEFAAGIEKNSFSVQQWQYLRGPDGRYWAPFLSVWKSTTTSKAYREEAKKEFAKAFDYIICLEANKRERTSCSAVSGNGE